MRQLEEIILKKNTMRTTTFILTAAALTGSILVGCSKKDSGGDSNNGITVSSKEVAVDVNHSVNVSASSAHAIKNPTTEDGNINIVRDPGNPTNIRITGVRVGVDYVYLQDNAGNRAQIKVNVQDPTQRGDANFAVDNSTIFLQRNVEQEITRRVLRGSGSYKIETASTAAATVRSQGSKLYVTGIGQGVAGKIKITDLTYNKTLEIPVYTIIPFKAQNAPTELIVGDAATVALEGVYKEATVDENGNYDRVKVINSNNAVVSVELVYEDIRNQVGQIIGKAAKSFTVKGLKAGVATVKFTNADGQTTQFSVTVKVFNPEQYFSVDEDGVLTVKTGVSLPKTIKLPDNAKKLPNKAFQGQTQVENINFNNVEVIEGNLFDNMSVGYISVKKVVMPKVKKVGYDTFRNARNLHSVEFPATLELLGDQSFKGCSSLYAVAFRGVNPPKGVTYDNREGTSASSAFDTDTNNKRRLFVPSASSVRYSSVVGKGSNFRYRKAPNEKAWFEGDDASIVVDIQNFADFDFDAIGN